MQALVTALAGTSAQPQLNAAAQPQFNLLVYSAIRSSISAGTCKTYHCFKGGPEEPPEGLDTMGCPVYSHPAQVGCLGRCYRVLTVHAGHKSVWPAEVAWKHWAAQITRIGLRWAGRGGSSSNSTAAAAHTELPHACWID